MEILFIYSFNPFKPEKMLHYVSYNRTHNTYTVVLLLLNDSKLRVYENRYSSQENPLCAQSFSYIREILFTRRSRIKYILRHCSRRSSEITVTTRCTYVRIVDSKNS